MYQHVKYVTNQILIKVKRRGFEPKVNVECGKLLWRLFRVFQAYNSKQRDATFAGIVNVVKGLRKIVNS